MVLLRGGVGPITLLLFSFSFSLLVLGASLFFLGVGLINSSLLTLLSLNNLLLLGGVSFTVFGDLGIGWGLLCTIPCKNCDGGVAYTIPGESCSGGVAYIAFGDIGDLDKLGVLGDLCVFGDLGEFGDLDELGDLRFLGDVEECCKLGENCELGDLGEFCK